MRDLEEAQVELVETQEALMMVIAERDTLRRLVETALNIRMYGERAPGGNENWRDWDRAASAYLFPKPPGGDA